MTDITKLCDRAYYVFDFRILEKRVAYLRDLLGTKADIA